MRTKLTLLLIICAGLCSCAAYNTVARTVGLPESIRPGDLQQNGRGFVRGAATTASGATVFDLEIQDSMMRYLERRRDAQ